MIECTVNDEWVIAFPRVPVVGETIHHALPGGRLMRLRVVAVHWDVTQADPSYRAEASAFITAEWSGP